MSWAKNSGLLPLRGGSMTTAVLLGLNSTSAKMSVASPWRKRQLSISFWVALRLAQSMEDSLISMPTADSNAAAAVRQNNPEPQ